MPLKKFEFPADLEFRYRIQPPSGAHRKFRLIRLHAQGGSETVKSAELDAVNAALLAGTVSEDVARRQLTLLVERLYREAGAKLFKTVSNSDNANLLARFWADYYRARRLVDRDSTYAKYRRAVEAVGELSLLTATADELQAALDRKFTGNKQRAIVGRLHTLLEWLKRGDVHLVMEHEEEALVRHLTRLELERTLSFIEDPNFCLMARVARGTGARIGELFAIRADAYRGNTLFVRHQVRRDGVLALAKSKRANAPGRNVFVLPEARPLIKKWLAVKDEVPLSTRLNAANILRSAAQKAFPRHSEKWVCFHDLRHSYAIELAGAGVSLLQISQQLGNSQRVCEKHYTGFMSSDETADMIERKLKAGGSK